MQDMREKRDVDRVGSYLVWPGSLVQPVPHGFAALVFRSLLTACSTFFEPSFKINNPVTPLSFLLNLSGLPYRSDKAIDSPRQEGKEVFE